MAASSSPPNAAAASGYASTAVAGLAALQAAKAAYDAYSTAMAAAAAILSYEDPALPSPAGTFIAQVTSQGNQINQQFSNGYAPLLASYQKVAVTPAAASASAAAGS